MCTDRQMDTYRKHTTRLITLPGQWYPSSSSWTRSNRSLVVEWNDENYGCDPAWFISVTSLVPSSHRVMIVLLGMELLLCRANPRFCTGFKTSSAFSSSPRNKYTLLCSSGGRSVGRFIISPLAHFPRRVDPVVITSYFQSHIVTQRLEKWSLLLPRPTSYR